MKNATVNFTTTEGTTNSTTQSFELMDSLEICGHVICLLFGLPTHSYILWLIVTGTGSGVASEFFIFNLSVCELGICLNNLVFVLSMWFTSLSRIEMFLAGLSSTGRPLFQCLICVERYLAVVHPVTFLKYKPLRYRVICCTVAWFIVLGCCFLCLLVSDEVKLILFLVLFLLFFIIQLFCLVAVLRALKQSGPGERARERKEENHMKRRAFDLILITTVSMAIIYVPYIVIGFVTILKQQIINALWSFGLICYVLAGFVQPVLYLHRAGKFFLSSKL
ncbi:uracil nucleotide/cysteinyl leukotriene receptor-like [Rhinichthys klamathensis goyatoka]|uniref:uracil nucleotide/cysteinyl leukotriene receptor-like n=1 Tax=Rhinichthys klamathensis goyatoka TaxID=3034132 RepID=UPI0024B4D6D9|nr:uracil nucleotide/cysteinyl leukotriene receptor-like [Rhinichthys klamathensis goyatoka]